MAQTVLASMTDGQIEDLANKLRDAARKHREEFPREATQKALRSKNIGMQLLATFRTLVEAASLTIRRKVAVDRSRTAAEMIEAANRHVVVLEEEVLLEMPMEGRDNDVVEFFTLGYDCSAEELEDEYEVRGLRPDPAAVIQAMIEDYFFADEHTVAVQWRDHRGRACCIRFFGGDASRGMQVMWWWHRWNQGDLFAGVPK